MITILRNQLFDLDIATASQPRTARAAERCNAVLSGVPCTPVYTHVSAVSIPACFALRSESPTVQGNPCMVAGSASRYRPHAPDMGFEDNKRELLQVEGERERVRASAETHKKAQRLTKPQIGQSARRRRSGRTGALWKLCECGQVGMFTTDTGQETREKGRTRRQERSKMTRKKKAATTITASKTLGVSQPLRRGERERETCAARLSAEGNTSGGYQKIRNRL